MTDSSPWLIKPKITKEKYLKILKEFKGGLWSKEDDEKREKMKKKEKNLNW